MTTPNRTAILQGSVFPLNATTPVNVEVLFDDILVYNGPAIPNSVDNRDDYLATWEFDPEIYENVKLTINVTNGSLTFVNVLMNYVVEPVFDYVFKDDVTWPGHVPININYIAFDYKNQSEDDFFDKYKMSKKTAKNTMVTRTLTFDNSTVFSDPSDGIGIKRTVKIDGEYCYKSYEDYSDNGWKYQVNNGSTIEMDLLVFPALFDDEL
jgi:hypothetical protein